jgi:hypothetical protein
MASESSKRALETETDAASDLRPGKRQATGQAAEAATNRQITHQNFKPLMPNPSTQLGVESSSGKPCFVPGPPPIAQATSDAASSSTELSNLSTTWEPMQITIHCDYIPHPLTGLAALEEVYRLGEIVDAQRLTIVQSEENSPSKRVENDYCSIISHRSFHRRVDELECLLGIKNFHTKVTTLEDIPNVIVTPEAPSGIQNRAKAWFKRLEGLRESVNRKRKGAEERVSSNSRARVPELFDGKNGSSTVEALLEEYYHRCIIAEGTLRILHYRYVKFDSLRRQNSSTTSNEYKRLAAACKTLAKQWNEELAKSRVLFAADDELISKYKIITGKELPEKSDDLKTFLMMKRKEDSFRLPGESNNTIPLYRRN